MYVANPITRKIQAIKITRDGARYRYQKLPDFVQSSDEWFRPVALRLGPDGCLYFVDWYNKIISHNEVPRNHPERDKKRGRIWRVKHKDVKPLDVPDFTKLSGEELVAKLGGPNTPQSHLAWQAIGDRQMKELAPQLKSIVRDGPRGAGPRVASLWALEAIGQTEVSLLKTMLKEPNDNVRREAVRALGSRSAPLPPDLSPLQELVGEADPGVRAEIIRVGGRAIGAAMNLADSAVPPTALAAVALCASLARPSLDGPTIKSTQSGKTIKAGAAYDREFERYLIRLFFERQPQTVEAFLNTDGAEALPVETRLLAALSLEPKTSATRVAELLPSLTRPPGQEELLRLAQFPDEPGVGDALKKVLQSPATGPAAMESLLKVRTRLNAAKLTPLLADAAKQLLVEKNQASLELGARLASSFQIATVEPELVRVMQDGWSGYPKLEAREYLLRPESLAALRALRELKSDRVDLFAPLAEKGGAAEQPVAVAALAASRNPKGPEQLASLYPNLSAASRRTALASLTATKSGASALVKSVRAGTIAKDELDAALLDKLQTVLGNDPGLATLLQEMDSLLQPMLRFEGKADTFVSTKYKLAGPFTVECWLKLDPGINNQDGILAGAGQLDMNFHDARFRVWVGGGQHDIVIAQRKTVPDVWTHYAVTRDDRGVLRIYINGLLDATSAGRNTNTFEQLDVGRTNPGTGGTAGWMNEFRVWKVARSDSQILADFDRTYRGESPIENSGNDPRRPGLVALLTGKQWPSLHGAVKIQRTMDAPPLLNAAESAVVAERFGRFRTLAEKSGATAHGQELFSKTCQACHSVGGQGGQIGPVLNGAGALGVEALLRNILTPNAAMEPGYRAFRVELKDGDVVDGLLVSQDPEAIVLRRQSADDLRIAQKDVRRAAFTKMSLMPEGLLDGLKPEEVTDLFAYLKTLK
jgi:putative heme-binding domain-containing protein